MSNGKTKHAQGYVQNNMVYCQYGTGEKCEGHIKDTHAIKLCPNCYDKLLMKGEGDAKE